MKNQYLFMKKINFINITSKKRNITMYFDLNQK